MLALGLWLSACAGFQIPGSLGDLGGSSGPKLSTDEVARGLKEALELGIGRGADRVAVTDGYFRNNLLRIPFPPEIAEVETRLRQIGMGSEVDRFILSLNRGAEEAAKEAKPIFASAIRSMTIQDAWGILKGKENEATEYLQRTTGLPLNNAFKPVIERNLEKVNATKYYTDLVNAYNRIPGVRQVNADLAQYATDRAISGLFVVVAQEETKIRKDPGARATDLLRKVFDSSNWN